MCPSLGQPPYLCVADPSGLATGYYKRHYLLRASIVHQWNGPVTAHRLGLLGCQLRDCESTDARLRATSLDDPSCVHLKFSFGLSEHP